MKCVACGLAMSNVIIAAIWECECGNMYDAYTDTWVWGDEE